MSNNFWLYNELVSRPDLYIESNYVDLITVEKDGIIYKIYTPSSDEYLITISIVKKALSLGANVISYPTTWCKATYEAISYGKSQKIMVIPHGKLFEILG